MPWRGTAAAQPLPTGHAGGMVIGMATRKVTITLDEAQLDQIRSLVQAGTAASVSGFVQHAVAVALDDVAGWGAMLAEALRQPAVSSPIRSAPGPMKCSAPARSRRPDAGVTLDAGGLIALDRDDRRVVVLLAARMRPAPR